MATFDCDNPEVREALERLREIVLREGGFLHEALRVVQRGPSLSLASGLAPDADDVLIRLPQHCLVPVNHFKVSLEGERFAVRPTKRVREPVQADIAQLMFAVFNATGKLAVHRQTFPSLCFAAEPAITAALKKLRPLTAEHLQMLQAGHFNKALVASFLKTRTLRNKRAADANVNCWAAKFAPTKPSPATTKQEIGSSHRPGMMDTGYSNVPVPSSAMVTACWP